MDTPLQQTKLWQNFLTDVGEKSTFQETKDFTFLAIEKLTPLGAYLFVPYGPVAHTKTGLKKAYDALETLAKEKNAIFIRIEPQSPENRTILQAKKAKKSHDLDPADTWLLDLTPEKSTLLTNMSQGTRTRHNQFSKKGLSVTTSKNPADIKHLVALQQKLAAQKKIGTFSEKYLETELKQPFATLYLVHYTPPSKKTAKIIAASLFFDHNGTRYYMQSAADADYKNLPATVGLLTTAIFDAKEKGLKKFDFWGIAPENAGANHPWAGFTAFKKSFGGAPVHYCGTYDLVLNPPKYQAYQLLRKANRLKRKIKK